MQGFRNTQNGANAHTTDVVPRIHDFPGKPFQPPRCESELLPSFLVRGAAQTRRVINRIRPDGFKRFFFTDVRRRRRTNETRQGRLPDSQRNGFAVDDVV